MSLLIGIIGFIIVGSIGIIFYEISLKKNRDLAHRALVGIITGVLAGSIVVFTTKALEISNNDPILLLIVFFLFLCIILFVLGVAAFITTYIIR